MSDEQKTMQLAEPCRVALLKFYAQAQQSKALYDSHASVVLRALGLDPADENRLDLDTGIISLAPKKEEPKGPKDGGS